MADDFMSGLQPDTAPPAPPPSAPTAPAAPAAAAPAATQPPVPNARRAPDGHFYVPDPQRQGKYLRVEHGEDRPLTITPPAPTPAPAATPIAQPARPPQPQPGSDFMGGLAPDTPAPPRPDPRQRLQEVLTPPDRDIDMSSGAPWNIQLALARADNPDEAAAMLERRVGPGNYGQDDRGRWWIKQGGKKVAVRPTGSFTSAAKNFMTDTAAASPALAGAAGGALAGAPFGGPVGAVVGAGLGAMAGKGASEAEKGVEGTFRKGAGEEVGDLAKEGVINSALQGAGPMLREAGGVAGEALRGFVGATPETKAMTARALRVGGKPPLMSAAPDAKSAQYDQKMRNLVMGNPDEAVNLRAVVGEAHAALIADGIAPAEAQAVLDEVMRGDARISGQEVGEGIHSVAQQYAGSLRAEVETATRSATQIIDGMEGQLRNFAAGQEGRLGEQVADAIADSRAEFGRTMGEAYAAIDRMAGNARIVPITAYRNRAQALVMITPPEQLPPALRMLAEAPQDLRLTFQQAHDLRSMFRELSRNSRQNLTPGLRAHRLLNATHEAEEALDAVADLGDNIDLAGIANDNGLPAAAVEALRETDQAYADGIARYYNATMNKLVKDARDGIYPDPNVVAKTILSPGHLEQTRAILELLPQQVRDQVARADAFNMISAVTDGATGRVNGQVLRRFLNDPARRAVMDLVYPPEVLATARNLADELAVLNGHLDVRQIQQFSSQGMQQALSTAVEGARELQRVSTSNVMRRLIDADPEVVDAAADRLLAGGRGRQLAQTRQFLGENSQEWRAVQRYALKKVLRASVIETPTLSKSIEGNAINEALAKFTDAEQELLFPGGMKEDLRQLAKFANFLFPAEMNDQGASLAAAAIKSKVPLHVRAVGLYGKYKVMGWIASHPTVLHFLADTVASGPGSGVFTRGAKRQILDGILRIATNDAETGPGRGAPDNPDVPVGQMPEVAGP